MGIKRRYNALLFEGYLVSSMAALVFYSLFTFKGSDPGPEHFFLASVMAVNYFFISHLWGWSSELKENGKLGAFFLFQFLFLQAYAFETGGPAILFFALVPVVGGVYFLNSPHAKGLRLLRGRGALLLSIGPLSYYIFSTISGVSLAAEDSLISLTTLAIWTASIFSWDDLFRSKSDRAHLKIGDERLFVHDLVNQTHGLNLYLNFKKNACEDIKPHETEELINEVKILQSLIKDHFHYEHRNLNNTIEWVSFEAFKKAHTKMAESFLPSPICEVSFSYTGWIDPSNDLHLKEKCMVHFPSIYRIMVNIVKNMSDGHTTTAEFKFHYDSSGLQIHTRNKLGSFAKEEDLSEGLSRLINEEKRLQVGDGLESIGAISQKLGGSFSFQIIDGYWHNDIWLPNEYETKKVA